MYDDYGRATEITIDGITETYGYDAQDVRVTVDATTQLWDRNGLPTLISTGTGDNYVHVDGVARDGNDWLLQDAVGSVRATVDQAGVVSAETAFTAFGEPLTGQTDSFGFAGEQLDTTGLLHLRARQYNPSVGRFTTVDPVQPGAPGTTGYNLYAYSGNNPTTWTDPTGEAVFAEYAALVGDQADATEIFASSVGNCATASINRATAGLQGVDLGSNPTTAIAQDCRDGATSAVTSSGAFFLGGRLVENAADIVSLNRRAKVLGAAPNAGVPRFDGPKPLYDINPAHVPGQGLRSRNPKTPLPGDAEDVYRNAVPDDPVNPKAWYGINADGLLYRFSSANGNAHFSGIAGVGDGVRNVSDYAIQRPVALVD